MDFGDVVEPDLEHLADAGAASPITRGGGRLPREEVRHGVTVHRVREPQFPTDVSAFVRWVESMNADMRELGLEIADRHEGDFDLVHSHDWLVAGATVAVTNASEVAERWTSILGTAPPGIDFIEHPDDRGLAEIRVAGAQAGSGVLPAPLAPNAVQ